jgi:hypothetical protein
MCDFSLHHVKSRPAKVGDKLRTVNFNTGTRGFAAPEDATTAVCILPGTDGEACSVHHFRESSRETLLELS